MMHRIRAGGVALAVLLTVAGPLPAQDTMDGDGSRRARRGIDVESVMSMRERLELSEDQIARLDELRAEEVQRRSAVRASVAEMRSQLRAGQIRRSEMMAFLEERRDAGGETRDALESRLDGILLPEQLESLEQIRAERRAFERGRRSGRREAGMRGRGGDGGPRAFRREGGRRGHERGLRRRPGGEED